jgi:hypothetical protein
MIWPTAMVYPMFDNISLSWTVEKNSKKALTGPQSWNSLGLVTPHVEVKSTEGEPASENVRGAILVRRGKDHGFDESEARVVYLHPIFDRARFKATRSNMAIQSRVRTESSHML